MSNLEALAASAFLFRMYLSIKRALEIATIMSPVGVNTEIIEDGKNGFIADDHEEWVEKISKLIEHPDLREEMGKEARKTVIDQYSVEANRDLYLTYFKEVLST